MTKSKLFFLSIAKLNLTARPSGGRGVARTIVRLGKLTGVFIGLWTLCSNRNLLLGRHLDSRATFDSPSVIKRDSLCISRDYVRERGARAKRIFGPDPVGRLDFGNRCKRCVRRNENVFWRTRPGHVVNNSFSFRCKSILNTGCPSRTDVPNYCCDGTALGGSAANHT
jgi:hypothetical protein